MLEMLAGAGIMFFGVFLGAGIMRDKNNSETERKEKS